MTEWKVKLKVKSNRNKQSQGIESAVDLKLESCFKNPITLSSVWEKPEAPTVTYFNFISKTVAECKYQIGRAAEMPFYSLAYRGANTREC